MLGFLNPFRSEPQLPDPMPDEDALQHALQYFEAPGRLQAPNKRVDPDVPQREATSIWNVRSMFKFGWFITSKSTDIMKDLVSYQVYGPKRPTWGIEMTLLSSMLRNISNHSELTNVVMLRTFMAIAGLVPTPSSALITPVTFQVRRRKLPGILRDADEKEDGSRELHGEWIVSREIWWKMQHEWKTTKANIGERVILFLHGGAYYVFSAATHRLITIRLSSLCGVRVFAINYRLAPETRFPGALHDALMAYLRLTEYLKIPPQNVIIAGDSAGGGLAIALLMYLRDSKLPMPGGAILMSPWVDLTMSCASWDSNAEYDICPVTSAGDHLNPVYCYMGAEGMRKGLVTNPYASPLFGRFEGLPPMLIQSGEAEVLRDECTLLAHKAKRAGVEVVHEIYQDGVHVFQSLPFFPAAEKAFQSCANFVDHLLDLQTRSEMDIRIGYSTEMQEKGNEHATSSMMRIDEEIGDSTKMLIVDSVGEESETPPDIFLAEELEVPPSTSLVGYGDQSLSSPPLNVLQLDETSMRARSERDGTTVDDQSPVSPRYSPSPEEYFPSPSASSSLLRSKSAAIIYSSANRNAPNDHGRQDAATNSRRHHRTATTFGSASSGFTPVFPSSRSTRSHAASPVTSRIHLPLHAQQHWAFSLGSSRPVSPTVSYTRPLSPDTSDTPENGYFAYAYSPGATIPATPAPAIRKRGRSGTVSSVLSAEEAGSAEQELERMCREWETDGPANVSVWCRRVDA